MNHPRLALGAVLLAAAAASPSMASSTAPTDAATPAPPSLPALEATLAQGQDVPGMAGKRRLSAVGVGPFLKAIDYTTDKAFRRQLQKNGFQRGALRNFRRRARSIRTTDGLSETFVFATAAGAEGYRRWLSTQTRPGDPVRTFEVPGMPFVTATTQLGREKGRYAGGGNVTWVQGTCLIELGVYSPDTGRRRERVLSSPLIEAAPKVLQRVTPVCGPAPGS